ncbi:hypothetical protein MVI01_34500 [Myxococcus virescens]|uniref:Uncharacterized protein n=1 Tax=Myxococcus virescens TaxID=83456 RepID=A0A511HDQ0_9BACT|nr:hypothetical protein MVI01_34500 [Myxococcus virescens]
MVERVPSHRLELNGFDTLRNRNHEHVGRCPQHQIQHHAIDPQRDAGDRHIVLGGDRHRDGAVLHDRTAIHRREQRHRRRTISDDIDQLECELVLIVFTGGVPNANRDQVRSGVPRPQFVQPRHGELSTHHRAGV